MGIRIMIYWEFMSPLLRVAKGKCKVEYINIGIHSESKTLVEFNVTKKDGQTSFRSITSEGISQKLFKRIEEYTKLMIDSYFRGMILQNDTFHWIEDSFDTSLEQWLDESQERKFP
jgi:hypothetical protein